MGHAVGVHDPSHDLRVGVDVRGRDVLVRADDGGNLVGVAASQVLQFVFGELVGIADNSALGATEGNVDDGAFPGHPGGERFDFVESDVGMIANSTFAGAAHAAVLNSETFEDSERTVIHLYRQREG